MDALWEALPTALLELILDRLPIADHLRFAAVCRQWQSVQSHNRLVRTPYARHPCQMPWMLFPDEVLSPRPRLFYSPSEKRYYRFHLPREVEGKRYCGSSHGWLLFVDPRSNDVLVMVNPLTGHEIQIQFPICPLMPQSFRVCLAVLSSPPIDPDCTVMLCSNRCYWYCRIHDTNWKTGKLISFPVICGGKFYLFGKGSKLVVLDPLSLESHVDMVGLPELMRTKNFLVESDGELLLACVTLDKFKHIKKVDIFLANLTQNMWVRLESIADRELFLDFDNCMCLPTVKTGGPGNRIYFTYYFDSFTAGSAPAPVPLWVEYDYANQQVVSSNLQTLKDYDRELQNLSEYSYVQENCWYDFIHWFMPSLS